MAITAGFFWQSWRNFTIGFNTCVTDLVSCSVHAVCCQQSVAQARLSRRNRMLFSAAAVFTPWARVLWSMLIFSEGWLLSATVSASVLHTPLSSKRVNHAEVLRDPVCSAGSETDRRRDLLWWHL